MNSLRSKLTALALAGLLSLSACADKPDPVAPREQAVGVASMVDENNRDYPDFRALEQALETDPTSVIPNEALDLVGGPEAFEASIADGTVFKVRDRTWAPDRTGGTVQITMVEPSGKRTQKLAFLLQDIKQRWYVLQTLPLEDIPKPVES